MNILFALCLSAWMYEVNPPSIPANNPAAWIAVLLNLVIFPLCFLIVRKFRFTRVPPMRVRWYDFAVRALLVACLVGAVVSLSFRIGAAALTLHLAAVPLGNGAALGLALCVSMVWNFTLYALRRRGAIH